MTGSLTLTFGLREEDREEPALTSAQFLPEAEQPTEAADQLLPGQVLTSTEEPTSIEWCLLPLYKIDQKGKERLWQIGFDPSTEKLVTIHGHVGGALQTDRRLVETKGSKSIQDQALQDARHKYKVKYRGGHLPRGEEQSTKIPAQRGVHYNPPWLPKRHSNEVRTIDLRFPVGIQPKLDGLRGRTWLDRDPKTGTKQAMVYTRGNIPYRYLIPHRQEMAQLLSYLPLGVGLDGEWYCHGMNFDELNGICRRSVNQEAALEEKVRMYIFDLIVAGKTLEERLTMLIKAYQAFLGAGHQNRYFQIVNTTWAKSHEEIVDFHNQYVTLGYEGAIIRKPACSKPRKIEESYYRGGQNNSLLKFKSFREEEVTIIKVTEAKGRETGTALFMVKDEDGHEFQVRPKGSVDIRRKWFLEPELCIGRLYTIQFFEKTQYGMPRFPRGKAFRDSSSKRGEKVY